MVKAFKVIFNRNVKRKVCSHHTVQWYNKFITSWTSKFKSYTFWEILLPSSVRWWEKYLSKRSLIKLTCSSRDKLLVLWTLNRQAKYFYLYQNALWWNHSPDDGRSISRNVAELNLLVYDVINFLFYENWTDKQKYFTYIKMHYGETIRPMMGEVSLET